MNMKSLIIATLALVAGAGAANAADLGRGSSDDGGYKDAIPESAMWTGVTLGVGIGGAFPTFSASDEAMERAGVDKSSFFGQAEAVLSYQFPRSPLVVSAYGDVTYNGLFKRAGGGVGGQLGYAAGNVQPYLLAGGDFVDGNSGATFGAGVKFRVNTRVNINVEWKHTEWDTVDFGSVSTWASTDSALVGVSYKLF
jgi:opacity protein-like surface antigen